MIKKVCFSPENTTKTHATESVLASEAIVSRMTKLAKNLKALAPKSDDFLYFSIIFLKSAEACLIDDKGLPKKVAGGEDAWGFFDENWKWHGNVQPHRNNNKDIFPESELKKAAADWVGLPLCRDHESSSVDGIRGIILDTHYDEKHKQIVGLCALDKVNYPDLARKVESGLVRYGSMGTAVETSVCSECGNKATTLDEYCSHITNKTAHGEINVGLKPIEYSLVVQPAEPGAVLLRCIASLQEYKTEFNNYGVNDVDKMLGKLSLKQAQHLEGIMKTACGDDGCSVSERKNIVRSFLENNSLLKASSEQFVSGESMNEDKAPGLDTHLADSTRLSMFGGSGPWEENPDFSSEDEGLLRLALPPESGEPLVGFASQKSRLAAKTASDNNLDDISINSLMEDIMNESRLRKRAELRRRLAYYQGGDNVDDKNWREPNTYKSENYTNTRDKKDKQMTGTYDFGGQESADLERKKKLSRAELQDRKLRRLAYMQGGAEGAEPNTYKSEDYKKYRDQMDKQMHQDGNMGGASGMFPGDEKTKEMHKRASAYSGPALSTKFSLKRRADGSVDHYGSVFEVYSGNRRVIASTARDIFGTELKDNWNWLQSKEYGQEVCRQIRASGLDYVGGLLKSAQALPPAGPPAGPPGGGMELPPLPDMGPPPGPPGGDMGPPPGPPGGDMGLPPLPGEDAAADADEGEEQEDPSAAIDSRLSEMEQLLDEVRDLVAALEDERLADVDVNVFTGKDKNKGGGDDGGGDLLALSHNLVTELKRVYGQLDESADELSMVAETYENINKLSGDQRGRFVKLASGAVKDADTLMGETRGLVRVASGHNTIVKKAFGFSSLERAAESMAGALKEGLESAGLAGVPDETISAIAEAQEAGGDALNSLLDAMGGISDAAKNQVMDIASAAQEAVATAAASQTQAGSAILDAAQAAAGAVSEANDGVAGLVSEAMTMRKNRREAILKQAESRMLAGRAAKRAALLQTAEENASMKKEAGVMDAVTDAAGNVADMVQDAVNKVLEMEQAENVHPPEGQSWDYVKQVLNSSGEAADEMKDWVQGAYDSFMGMLKGASDDNEIEKVSAVKEALAAKMEAKKADEERESYRVKLRRAYDVGIEMQNKGLLTHTKTALDKQVDEIMSFDDRAFEAFKRSIASARSVRSMKIASDLGGVNIGVEGNPAQASSTEGVTANTLASLWD